MVNRSTEFLSGGAWDNEYQIGLKVPFTFSSALEATAQTNTSLSYSSLLKRFVSK